jgi:hypothetical protein
VIVGGKVLVAFAISGELGSAGAGDTGGFGKLGAGDKTTDLGIGLGFGVRGD